MADFDRLLEIEYQLAAGDGSTYRRRLREDAVIVIPGERLDKAATVAAMDASPGWDELAIEDARAVDLADDAALLTYTFRGRRDDSNYTAILASAYVRDGGDWRLVFHQQTPIDPAPR